jgi:hypothetical protein
MTDIEFKLEVVQRLATIETKIDALGNHEGRIQALENGRSRWGGIIAAASVVLSAVASLLTKHFIK